jgi:hypothetical protein
MRGRGHIEVLPRLFNPRDSGNNRSPFRIVQSGFFVVCTPQNVHKKIMLFWIGGVARRVQLFREQLIVCTHETGARFAV